MPLERYDASAVQVIHQDPLLVRRGGDNVFCRVPITGVQAAKGFTLKVRTIDGFSAQVVLPPGTKTGTVFQLKGLGVLQKGDQFVEVVIDPPLHDFGVTTKDLLGMDRIENALILPSALMGGVAAVLIGWGVLHWGVEAALGMVVVGYLCGGTLAKFVCLFLSKMGKYKRVGQYLSAADDVQETFKAQEAAYYGKVRELVRRAEEFNDQESARARATRLHQVEQLRALSNREFEEAVANVFAALGYDVEVTPPVDDRGRDIIARKGEETVFIECKQYRDGLGVGRPTLQRLVGALEGNARGVLVTTSRFSKPAVEYAQARGLELIDGMKLSQLFSDAYGESSAGVQDRGLRIMCERCGEIIWLRSSSPTEMACQQGHSVKFTRVKRASAPSG